MCSALSVGAEPRARGLGLFAVLEAIRPLVVQRSVSQLTLPQHRETA